MNTPPQQTVSAAIDLRLLVTAGPALPLRADIDYSPDDPYAVRVAFHTGADADDVVQWTFARSLLTEGVTHPVGDGDVQVWPSNTGGVSSVCLSLSSPSGRALFEAPRADVAAFLARTYSCVPTGKESEFVDLDAELSLLLWSEPEA